LKESILFLAAVVLGGPGNMPGVVVGAIVVSYLPERFRFLDTSRYFWFGVALVLMMIFRPAGLWPRRQHGRKRGIRRDQRSGQVAAPTEILGKRGLDHGTDQQVWQGRHGMVSSLEHVS
jgi:uncharacterized membrane protein YfcA